MEDILTKTLQFLYWFKNSHNQGVPQIKISNKREVYPLERLFRDMIINRRRDYIT